MTSLHTLPIPHQTARIHEHAWTADSRHPTSEGVVVYVRCAECGTHRVDLETHPQRPATALSAEFVRTRRDETSDRDDVSVVRHPRLLP
ncbi:hypothetical protein BMW26_12480 [Microbacterium sp. 1.5R]|uniref:hypothetical protein n=1 Tax=Microbacterium sp. 1.5R TaxID=1916917 RepID=UPI000909EA4B|nr:hypothetical protein [Microbacterium sp. 1.5R]APH45675.1 hypothetical protein BMW26_12480 [Microbacterium sp. 1.5R]